MTDSGRSGSRWEPDHRLDEAAGVTADEIGDGGPADAGDPA
jgi:hypothetical protein